MITHPGRIPTRLLAGLWFGSLSMGCDVLFPEDSLNDGPDPEIIIGNSVEVGRIQADPLIRSRRGGSSVEFGGHSVWAFGDTHFGQNDADGLRVHGSSMSWTDDTDAGNSISGFDQRVDTAGVPRRFLPLTDTEFAFNLAHDVNDCEEAPCGARVALWPSTLVYDDARARVLVFYQKVITDPSGARERRGVSVATWEAFDADPVRPEVGGGDDPTLLFTADEPRYGSAALIVGDLLYVYGIDSDGDDRPCTLARVPVADVLDRSAWRFRNGDGEWVSDVNAAEPLFGGNDIMHVSFNAHLNSYVAIHSEPQENDVMIRVADSVGGPWSRSRSLFTARAPLSEDVVRDALPHPGFAENGGREMYISYSRTTGFNESELRLVKVRVQPSPDG